MPLSVKTRLELEKRSGDWPFDDNAGDWQGEWTDDFAEWLMLAQLYQRELEEGVPVPTIAELGDPIWEGIEQSTDPRAKMARQIQDKIIQRLENGKPLWDLIVKGWVYQFWLSNQRLPTVEEVAELMRLSRPALYYRGYNAKRLAEDYFTATGELKRELPDLGGLGSVQRQNVAAKKQGFGSIDRDPFADD
jgi:hypothetical protein